VAVSMMRLPKRIALITGSTLTTKNPIEFPITRSSEIRNRNHRLPFALPYDFLVNVCRNYPR
jgi:hypothetical protein